MASFHVYEPAAVLGLKAGNSDDTGNLTAMSHQCQFGRLNISGSRCWEAGRSPDAYGGNHFIAFESPFAAEKIGLPAEPGFFTAPPKGSPGLQNFTLTPRCLMWMFRSSACVLHGARIAQQIGGKALDLSSKIGS